MGSGWNVRGLFVLLVEVSTCRQGGKWLSQKEEEVGSTQFIFLITLVGLEALMSMARLTVKVVLRSMFNASSVFVKTLAVVTSRAGMQ